VWEDELARDYVDRLTNVDLKVEVADRWIWKLHSSKWYTIKSDYNKG
jgi:hypothetical protein